MEQVVTPDTIVHRRTEEVFFSEVQEQTIMLSVRSSKYYGFEAVGSHIWHLIEQPISIAAICNDLMNTFEVEQPRCETEVTAFIQQLLDEGLVQLTDVVEG